MASNTTWPTALMATGAPPPLKELLEAADPLLKRQATYAFEAAVALKQTGQEPQGFQKLCAGQTIPLITRQGTTQAAVYTWSEPWDADAIDTLAAWRDTVRAAIPEHIPIIVVTPDPTDALRKLPGIAHIVALPYSGKAG